jgi:hypothetical protein
MLFIAINNDINIATPVCRINPSLDIAMKRGIRPIHYTFDMPMFQGIYVYVIDMALIVGIVAYQMLPIMPLP